MTQILFQTDQSGANQNVCSTAVASTVTFNFSLSANYEAYSANIVMKKGSGTTSPVTVTIYNQPNGGGSAVDSASVPASSVTQSFAPIEFLFSSLNLSAGTSYSLVLSSAGSCSGSTPYSFKSGNFQVVDRSTGGVINTGYGIISSMSAVTTASASSRASKLISASPASVATVSASPLKSKALAASISASATLSASSKSSMAASASTSAAAAVSASPVMSSAMASSMQGSSSLVASSGLGRIASASLSSGTTVTASPVKRGAATLSSYAAVVLGAVAKMARAISAGLNSQSGSTASAALNNDSECQIKENVTLSGQLRLNSSGYSEINCSSLLGAVAEIARGISSDQRSECSVEASMKVDRSAVAQMGASVTLAAEMSGAKTLFSAFASPEALSTLDAAANAQYPLESESVWVSLLLASATRGVSAESLMSSETTLEAIISSSKEGERRREGSGHYVLNSGAFTLRQWRSFTKASDNHIPQRRDADSRRIDLRAPGLLRR